LLTGIQPTTVSVICQLHCCCFRDNPGKPVYSYAAVGNDGGGSDDSRNSKTRTNHRQFASIKSSLQAQHLGAFTGLMSFLSPNQGRRTQKASINLTGQLLTAIALFNCIASRFSWVCQRSRSKCLEIAPVLLCKPDMLSGGTGIRGLMRGMATLPKVIRSC